MLPQINSARQGFDIWKIIRTGPPPSPLYSEVIMGAMTSKITTIVYSTVHLGADKKTSKPRVMGLCDGNSPYDRLIPRT